MSSLWFDQEHLEHSVSPAYPAIAPQSCPCHPARSILADFQFEGSLTEKKSHHGTWKEFTQGGGPGGAWVALPDVALLKIFDLYLGHQNDLDDLYYKDEKGLTAWHVLVHVCRTWRNVVFGSPLRLNLRVFCVPHRTTVREMMVSWPALPIIVSDNCDKIWDNRMGVDNIVAILEHSDRICQLRLFNIRSWQLENVLAAEMQRPFPTLTLLDLRSKGGETAPVVPDSFLGGSAPQLRILNLKSILFLGLPKLLLSATRLVHLYLCDIPHSGYISPETMVACLLVLTRLEKLGISFQSPQSRPDRNSQRLPTQTRTLLPILKELEFNGVSEYLEVLVARIDAPLLDYLMITFFHQLIIDTPQLTQFISRCSPKFKTLDEAHLDFFDFSRVGIPSVLFYPREPLFERLIFGISCNYQSDWQLSFATQMCSSLPQDYISTVERLYIDESDTGWDHPPWQDDIEGCQWLELLRPFTAVKALYISKGFTPHIVPALQELVGERAMEVLPALQTLFLTDLFSPVQDTIEQFVAARQLAGHPITVSHWRFEWASDEESDEELDELSYETDDG